MAESNMYVCPMHSGFRHAGPGQCPTCGMALLPEGTRFALLHQVMGSKLHLAVMGTVMVAAMAAIMMMLR